MKKAMIFIIPAILGFGVVMWLIYQQRDATKMLQLALALGVIGVGSSVVIEVIQRR